MCKAEEKRAKENTAKVEIFAAVKPGFCRTAFNGFKGTKDPLDGVEIVARLIEGKGDRKGWKSGSFLEFEEGEVPWL